MLADELRAAAVQAGYEVRSPHAPTGGVLPALIVDCDAQRRRASERRARPHSPTAAAPCSPRAAPACCCARGARWARWTRGAARSASTCFRPCEQAELVELTRSESSSPVAAARAERFFQALGKHVAWVGDAPGLVLGRIVCQVINESAFALGEGVGERDGHRHRDGARAEPPARPARVGGRRSAWTTCWRCSRRCARSTARSATARPRRCAGWRTPGGSDARPGPASSTTTQRELTAESHILRAAERFNQRERRAATLPALPRRPPRRRVAVPGLLGRRQPRPRTASRRRSSPRCAPTRGCARTRTCVPGC